MMAVEYYIFTGRDDEEIPPNVTHVRIDISVSVIPERAFSENPNIEEVEFNDDITTVKRFAFYKCPSLRRVVMRGVKVIEGRTFEECEALTDVECDKLEIIKEYAFAGCKSLIRMDLESVRIVERYAFWRCFALRWANFGSELERIDKCVFYACTSLRIITLPLKDDVLTSDDIFTRCENLEHVDLVKGVHQTVAALLLEEWKTVVYKDIALINQILLNLPNGSHLYRDDGKKSQTIQFWIRSLLLQMNKYKAEHRSYLNEAAATLDLALTKDILFNNVLPFLELPSHIFDGGEDEEEEDSNDIDD